jgi:phenylacetate-CoA ligase
VIESLRTWSLLRELRAPPEGAQLAALQDRLLLAAVAYAYAEVPFYRRAWSEAEFDAPGFAGLRELARIPVLPTDVARAAIESGELLADEADVRGVVPFHTSGASGRRLAVHRGVVEQRLWRAGGLRMWLEHGYRWTDTTLRFDSQSAPAHPLQSLRVSRTVWVSNELPLEQRLGHLAALRPQVVVGTPTVLRRICALAAERGTRLARPRIVFSQGEVLDAAARALVEEVLGVAPVELYGLTEVGYVGWQCERREALHANADLQLVELLRDERPAAPGELGRVVITDLRSRTLPLLRYDTGDLAVAPQDELCVCGRALPLLGRIEGRVRRMLTRGDGTLITTRDVVEALGWLAPDRFRVQQDTGGRILLEVAAGENADAAAAALEGLVGEGPILIHGSPLPPPRDGSEKTHGVVSQTPLVLG